MAKKSKEKQEETQQVRMLYFEPGGENDQGELRFVMFKEDVTEFCKQEKKHRTAIPEKDVQSMMDYIDKFSSLAECKEKSLAQYDYDYAESEKNKDDSAEKSNAIVNWREYFCMYACDDVKSLEELKNYYRSLAEAGPAVIHKSGKKEYYEEGQHHRIGAPAVEDGENYEYYVQNQLHRTDGPAKLIDGVKEYYLRNTKVDEWLVETPANQIDPKKLYEITNAQVRAEFVSKVGINRIVQALSKGAIDKQIIDLEDGTKAQYELHMLKLPPAEGRGGRPRQTEEVVRPYLGMLNPSVPGLWHFEGVDPKCKTVREALAFRNGTDKLPEKLT